MKVLFVCNNAFNEGNGLSVSIHNTIRKLREHGVDARLMAIGNPNPGRPSTCTPTTFLPTWVSPSIISSTGRNYDNDKTIEALISMFHQALERE